MLAGGVNPFYGITNAANMSVRSAAYVNKAADRGRAYAPAPVEKLGLGEKPQEEAKSVEAPKLAPPPITGKPTLTIAKPNLPDAAASDTGQGC